MRQSDQQRLLGKVAYDYAMGYGHDYFGTEHVMMALLTTDGDLLHALQIMGVDPERVRSVLIEIAFDDVAFIPADELLAAVGVDLERISGAASDAFGPGVAIVAKGMLHTPRQSQVEAIAPVEAERLGHREVRFGHIVLALLRQDERARLVFTRAGVGLAALRRAVLRAMDVEPEIAERYESERVAAERADTEHGHAIRDRFMAAVPAEGELDAAIDGVLRERGHLGLLKGEDVERLRARAADAGFVVLEAARDATTCWIVTEPSLKQLIVMSASESDDGGWYAGVDDLRKLPHWLKDDDYPQRPRGRG